MLWISFATWNSSHTWCTQRRLYANGRWTPFVVITPRSWTVGA